MTSLSANDSCGSALSPSRSRPASDCSQSPYVPSATSPEPRSAEVRVVAELVTELHAHEQLLASLAESNCRLLIATSRAQAIMSDRLGYLGAHQVIGRFSEAQTHLSAAASSVADGHRRLSRLGSIVGYRTGESGDFGDYSKDPKAIIKLLFSAESDDEARQAS